VKIKQGALRLAAWYARAAEEQIGATSAPLPDPGDMLNALLPHAAAAVAAHEAHVQATQLHAEAARQAGESAAALAQAAGQW
jgi:hypothetical protein